MKTIYKIAVWIVIASIGTTFCEGSLIILLIGLFILRCSYKILWECLLILFVSLFIFSLFFWILIS